MAEVLKTYQVHGIVTDEAGKQVAGAAVVVSWQQIRSRAALIKGTTGADGAYDLRYVVPAAAPGRLLLVVEATWTGASKTPTVLTSAVTEAQDSQQIDLNSVARDTSDFTMTTSAIAGMLNGLTLPEIVENSDHQDISFLSRELNQDDESVMRLAIASRLESAFKIPAPVFYAFLAQRVPSDLPAPLLEASQDFTVIDPLVQRIGTLIFELSSSVQENTLTDAIARNMIGPQLAANTPNIVQQLQKLRTTNLLTQPYLVGKPTLGQLLEVVKLPAAKQQAFAAAIVQNSVSMRNFWRSLGDGKHGVTAAEASQIERVVSIGAFVRNHLPLVQLLLDGFNSGTYKALPDLARLSEKDWIAMVTKTGAPEGIDPTSDASAEAVFALVIYERVTRAYPTAALSSRIAAGSTLPEPQRAPLKQFFLNNPSLELIKHNIPVFVKTQGDKAFTGIGASDRAAVLDNARKMQRVLRVIPQVDSAQALLGIGIHSALQIANLGQQRFVAQAATAGISVSNAERIFRVSSSRYAHTVSQYLQLNRDAMGVWPSAIGKLSDLAGPMASAVAVDPSLATLFGSQDYCEVDSCTSVLSPTAYLCDLLLWLRNHPQGAGTALDVLDDRRPDIRHLLLNCANTETELPYIDLVNELLADAIVAPTDPNSAVNPLWKQTTSTKSAEELRASPEFFNQDAFSLLFGASHPQALPYSAGLDGLRTYLQQLKVPLWQLKQALLPIHNPSSSKVAAVAAERLGIAPHEVDLIGSPNFAPADVVWNIANAATAMAPIPAFLQASSLSYNSLLELLQSTWVQGALNVAIQGIDDTCDTSVQSLGPSPLDAGFLDRAHRFLRTWRHAGYKMWELDLLLTAPKIGAGTLDAAALAKFHSFWQVQNATGLAVDQQLAFYQDLDTASHRNPDGSIATSLYSRTFLNPAVIAVASDPDLAAIASGGAVIDPVLVNHLAGIQAALGIPAADVALLFGLTDGTLTLENLSLLYRVSALAKASRFSISNLLSAAPLLTPGPTTAAIATLFDTPEATLSFLAQAQQIQQSGFTIDALQYLLTPTPWSTATQMTEADITGALTSVRQALIASSGGDTNGSAVAATAANAHRPADVPLANDVTALLLGQLQVNGKTLLSLMTDPAISGSTSITPAAFPDQFSAVQLLDKVAVVVRRLRLVSTDLSWLFSNAAVYGGLDFTKLPVTTAQAIIPLTPLLNTLLLVKLSRLFTAAQPQSTVQTLFDVIDGTRTGTFATESALHEALAGITGWASTDISAFTTALGVAFPADYSSASTYDSLRTLAAMSKASTATGAQLVDWSAVPNNELDASAKAVSALAVVKALHPDHESWLAYAPTITNKLRERRSTALQAYLMGQRNAGGDLLYSDVNALFDHFLIDIQMSSCEATTRVVQAYIAVQIFVERCFMNLEAPNVVVDPTLDETWKQWEWMKRFRIWQANREVFLYPENWLIESQRPNRSEIYKTLEQEVRQNASTTDYLETVVLNYVDRLDELAHLTVTGTCLDPTTGAIHVIGRTLADPPTFYYRSLVDGAWTGWTQIPVDIRSNLAVPALYRGRLCVFWPEVKIQSEPRQNTSGSGNQDVGKYVKLSVNFSVYRNGDWAPALGTPGAFFDKPLLTSDAVSDPKAVESLYTIKVMTPAAAAQLGASIYVDIFRYGDYIVGTTTTPPYILGPYNDSKHIARAVFDGRISEMRQRNFTIVIQDAPIGILQHAQAAYGPDALPLLPLADVEAEMEVYAQPNLNPRGGGFLTNYPDPAGNSSQTIQLLFNAAGSGDNAGPLLEKAPLPYRVLGSVSDPGFVPSNYFFYQDKKRCFHVATEQVVLSGSAWAPTVGSYYGVVPFELQYHFHRFYHPFTRLFWHQLSSGGFASLYDRNLQLNPDQVDPTGAEAFSFQAGYLPETARVEWDNNEANQDREFLDFSYKSAYAVYNWELFFHIPLYIAELLSQNQQFEDAMTWFHYIFDPTRPGTEATPKRFWIPKPLYDLTSSEILAENINQLLQAVNNGDPSAIGQVESWRTDPFNPFLLADQRPVAYMKRVVMSYLDNLIAYADNLFASESREALSEATLLYVIASEILGPQPNVTTPPQHADESYDELELKLDAFANAMVDIENTIGGTGSGSSGSNNGIPVPQTFYFKIPSNDKLLSYWTTVADRLFKLRHCQNIQGHALQLALFDAPIDPGLLIRAQSAGVDLSSVLSDVLAPLPNYRFTFLYTQALDFVNAVRAYGALLLTALEKSDADKLATILATNQLQLLQDTDQTLGLQVDQAQKTLDALTQSLDLSNHKLDYATDQSATLSVINSWEQMGLILQSFGIGLNLKAGLTQGVATVAKAVPDQNIGATGSFGSPTATAVVKPGEPADSAAKTWATFGAMADKSGMLCLTMGKFMHTQDDWNEKVKEANDDIAHTNIQIDGATIAVQIAQQNRDKNQIQIDQVQAQADLLTSKFTNQELYDWMAAQLSDTYFQSFKLAYRMCKQVEKCYQFELGISDSNFIQFGYWDSLHKGLLAGERLNHDLRRMQSSYIDGNRRRFEISRFIPLSTLDAGALQGLLSTGACDFTVPESLFDHDYPGHYNRHLLRVSVTVVYPTPTKFDNVKATLTMVSNKVRVSTDTSPGYAEDVSGADPRFVYNYGAVPQKIVLGNAQDDPGLFLTALNNNLTDTRYLPFENAGAVSSWHFEMPPASNEINLAAVSDVILHFYYTSLDGGDDLKQAAQSNSANLRGLRIVSAQNDFPASSGRSQQMGPWQAFLSSSEADPVLSLPLSEKLFPQWKPGRTISVSSVGVIGVFAETGTYFLESCGSLGSGNFALDCIPNLPDPRMCGTMIPVTSLRPVGTCEFKLRKRTSDGVSPVSQQELEDLLLVFDYQVSG